MDNLVSIMIIFAQRMCRHLSNNGKSRDTGTNLSSNLMTRLMLKIKNGFSGERSLVLPKMVTDMMKADPIASILYVTDIGYYPKAENHYRERKEPIGQYVFIYCIDGFGSYDVDGKHYEVSPNQYFILPAGKPHTYQADTAQPWTIYWIHFSGSLAEHYAADTMAPISVNPGLHSRISNRINMFEELFDALNSGYSIENIRYSMSLFHHYLKLAQVCPPIPGSRRTAGRERRCRRGDTLHEGEFRAAHHTAGSGRLHWLLPFVLLKAVQNKNRTQPPELHKPAENKTRMPDA